MVVNHTETEDGAIVVTRSIFDETVGSRDVPFLYLRVNVGETLHGHRPHTLYENFNDR